MGVRRPKQLILAGSAGLVRTDDPGKTKLEALARQGGGFVLSDAGNPNGAFRCLQRLLHPFAEPDHLQLRRTVASLLCRKYGAERQTVGQISQSACHLNFPKRHLALGKYGSFSAAKNIVGENSGNGRFQALCVSFLDVTKPPKEPL